MSMRPTMMTIFGIDDLKCEKSVITDNRLKKIWPVNWFEELFEAAMDNPPPYLKFNPYPNYFYEAIQWDAEFGIPGVMGLITSQLPYDSDVVRALAMLDNKYMQAGYAVLPCDNPTRKSHARFNIEDKHMYQQGFYNEVPQWIEAANYLFEHLGLDIKPEEMKWMLYWQWS